MAHKPVQNPSPGVRNFVADRLNDGASLGTRAVQIGVARQTLALIEAHPGVMPTPKVAKKVADFYGCDVTQLWPLPEQAAA